MWPWIVGGGLVIAIGATAAGISLYSRATDIQSELIAAQKLIPRATESVKSLDLEAVNEAYTAISSHTGRAADLTADPLWWIAERLPWAGTTFTAVTDLASITDDAVKAMGPLVDVAPSFMPENLAPVDGSFPVDAIASASATVSEVSRAFDDFSARIDGVNVEGALSQVVDAKSTLGTAITALDETLDTVDTVVSVLPTILGVDGEKRYLLVFQNNAEALGLGGSAASQSLVTAKAGKIEIVGQGSSRTYKEERVDVDLPDSAFALYGPRYASAINLTPSRPDWPSDAQIMKAFWQRDMDSGRIDGVASIDPLALARILGATGPVSVDGVELNQENAVSVLLNEVYGWWDYPEVVTKTDAFFADAADAVFDRLSGGALDVGKMVEAVVQSIDQGSIMFWSADPAVVPLIEATGSRLSGSLPTTNDETTTVGVYFRDTSSSKIDYYMDSAVDVSSACNDGTLELTVTATLRLDLTRSQSVGLPVYVRSSGWKGEKYRTQVFMYAPPGMSIKAIATNGTDVRPIRTGNIDLGRVVAPFEAMHVPGEEFTVTAQFSGPITTSPIELRTTPMIRPTVATIKDGCS